MCHEWRYDGGFTVRQGRRIRTGYYSRIEWPDAGGIGKQYYAIAKIFDVILRETALMHRGF